MFKKCLLTILLVLGFCPVFAGELEDKLAQGKRVFLYLYTPNCGYCKKFAPRYDKLSKMYDGQYNFVKIDASTLYGMKVMRMYNGMYVPYVLLLNPKDRSGVQISPSCLLDRDCIEKSMKEFKV